MIVEDCKKCTEWDRLSVCLDGEVYGPCDYEDCGGACVSEGACLCECHKELVSE